MKKTLEQAITIAAAFANVLTLLVQILQWIWPSPLLIPPQILFITSAIGLALLLILFLFFAFKSTQQETWEKIVLIVLYILAVINSGWMGTQVQGLRVLSSNNRLNELYDFESSPEGWLKLASEELRKSDTPAKYNIISQYPEDPHFPGTMTAELTRDRSLTGESSLRINLMHRKAGTYKSYLYRQGTVNGHSITIYVLVPKLDDVSFEYLQLCVPSHDWVCSYGVRLEPGEWTPVTIDLHQEDKNGLALSRQLLTELALQWFYVVKKDNVYLDIYLDAFEVKRAGP